MNTTAKRNICKLDKLRKALFNNIKTGYKVFAGTGGGINVKDINKLNTTSLPKTSPNTNHATLSARNIGKSYNNPFTAYPLTPEQMNLFDNTNNSCLCDKCHPFTIKNTLDYNAGSWTPTWTPAGANNTIKYNNNMNYNNMNYNNYKKHIKKTADYIMSFSEIPFKIRKIAAKKYTNTYKYMYSDVPAMQELGWTLQNKIIIEFEKKVDIIKNNMFKNQKAQFSNSNISNRSNRKI